MPPWNDGNLYTLAELYGAQQARYFYDGTPRASLPLALQALDREVDAFAVRVQQQLKFIYGGIRYTELYDRFERDTLALAGPLLERRRQACQAMNASSDRLCVSFPPEIVSRIFEFSVAGVQVDDTIPVPPQLSGTLCLASVTRAWRSLTLANPNLWVSFRLRPASTVEDDNGMRLSAFESFLRRSCHAGLHIHLAVDAGWDTDFDRLVAIVRREAHRIRTLHLVVAPQTPARFLAPLDFPFPNAEVVTVDADGLSLLTPRVSHLRLRVTGTKAFRPDSPSITFLDLDGISLYGIRVVLESVVTLKTLKAKVAPGTLDKVLAATPLGVLTVTHGGAVVVVSPMVHDGLESLVVDDDDVLHTVTLPSLNSLCMWGNHSTLAPFLARSACTLTRFGVDSPWSLGVMTGLATIRHLYIETSSLARCGDIFSALILHADPANPHSANLLITRLWTITVSIRTRGSWPSWDSRPPYLLSTLAEFHNRYGGRLERLDLHAQDISGLADVWYGTFATSPRRCPIRVNGYPIRFYNTSSFHSPPTEEIGRRDRLRCRDWAVYLYLWAVRLFDAINPVKAYQRRYGGWSSSGWDAV